MLGKYKDLTPEQIDFIVKNFYKLKYDEIAHCLNVSKTKVVAQTQKLQAQGILGKKPRRRLWTKDQEEKLLELVKNNCPIKMIVETLKKKSSSVVAKIKQMKRQGKIDKYIIRNLDKQEFKNVFSSDVTEWSEEEKQYLLANCKCKTPKFLAQKLHHSIYDVMCELRKLNLSDLMYQTQMSLNAFSQEEDFYIVNNLETDNRFDIQQKLPNHDWKSILHRGRMFGKFRTDVNGKIPYDEILVEQYLKDLGIDYQKQKRIYYNEQYYYIVDFLIKNKIIIEVQGKYWHCHPDYVPNPNAQQQQRIKHDFKKKKDLQNMGYKVVWLWEQEILENEQECKNKILSFAS